MEEAVGLGVMPWGDESFGGGGIDDAAAKQLQWMSVEERCSPLPHIALEHFFLSSISLF